MGRKQKHPEHKQRSEQLLNKLLDDLVSLWTEQENPELKEIAEEIELSPAKVRKLLITAGVRDKKTYYESPVAQHILMLHQQGKKVDDITRLTGLSKSSVVGYLPHTKIVYSLDTMSAESERIRLYRARQRAVAALHIHTGMPDESLWLWKAVIAFEAYPFRTSGRGSREGVKFTYTVSREGGSGGRHYGGTVVDGYGNEIFITSNGEQLKRSISRSTVELAYRRAVEMDGDVPGPKALGLPGAGSYVFVLLQRFGLIKKE